MTAANRHDVTQLLPLVGDIPPVRGCVGRPRVKPDLVQGDRGYDSQPHRLALHRRGIRTALAKRRTAHGSGLGRTRWVVERTLGWLSKCRGILVRYDKKGVNYLGLIQLACGRYWYRRLHRMGGCDSSQDAA